MQRRMILATFKFETLMPLTVRYDCRLVLPTDERKNLDFMLTVTHCTGIEVLIVLESVSRRADADVSGNVGTSDS